MTKLREDIRNIAIIAHVDHGKTTLVDKLLKQSETLDARTELAERNDTYQKREVKLYAKSGSVIREIVVSQSGIQRYRSWRKVSPHASDRDRYDQLSV